MAAAKKDPEYRVLFTRQEKRYRVEEGRQQSLFQNPNVQTYTTHIAVHYCAPMSVIRTWVGGDVGGWRDPIIVNGAEYEAITAALVDSTDAAALLPDFETPEEAIADWRHRTLGARKHEEFGGEPEVQ